MMPKLTILFTLGLLLLLPPMLFAQESGNLESLLEAYGQANGATEKVQLGKRIATAYQLKGAYQKSVDYLAGALELLGEEDKSLKLSLLEDMKDNFLMLKDYEQALKVAKDMVLLEGKANSPQKIRLMEEVALLSQAVGQYQQTIPVYIELEKLYTADQLWVKAAETQMQIGFLYQKMGHEKPAKSYFTQAQQTYTDLLKTQQDPTVMVKMATCLMYQTAYTDAIYWFEKALAANEDSPYQKAEIQNYLGTCHLLNGSFADAVDQVQASIAISELMEADKLTAESYQVLSEIYAAEGDYQASQKALHQQLALKEKIEGNQKRTRQALIDKQIEAEKNENAIKQAIAREKEKEMALKQARLEADKQKQELAIQEQQLAFITQENELQQALVEKQRAEKQQVAQALALAKEQLEAEKRQKEIDMLQQQQALKDMALKRKELEEQEKARAIELLEAEKVIQNQQLEQEAASKKYFIAGLVVSGAFIFFILFMFMQRGKANRLLKRQQFEISEKNEELLASEEEIRQNMEELQATQELLAEQKQVLQVQFQKVTNSINYAETIQNAILPHVTVRQQVFPENFLIYRPKDIVSGDFYWISEQDGKKMAAVIDCTGHGVPGAFMSMIGHNIMTEITEQMGIYDPAAILSILHKQIREKLNQKEGANNDGMDMGICLFENVGNGQVKMTYAGAKHRLFYVKDQETLQLDGDRKSIGGKHAADEIPFTNQQVIFSPADKVYMTSDGFLDQANKKRKNFSARRFKELIEKHHAKPLFKQKIIFETALEEHQQDVEQRDDITLLALAI